MDIFLIVIGAICLLVGFAGCFLPVLPGPPLSYLGLLLLHFTDKVQFTVTQLVVWGVLVVVVQVLDYITPVLGSKYGGGSKWGNWGCIIGTLVGRYIYFSSLGYPVRPVCRSRDRRVVRRQKVIRSF